MGLVLSPSAHPGWREDTRGEGEARGIWATRWTRGGAGTDSFWEPVTIGGSTWPCEGVDLRTGLSVASQSRTAPRPSCTLISEQPLPTAMLCCASLLSFLFPFPLSFPFFTLTIYTHTHIYIFPSVRTICQRTPLPPSVHIVGNWPMASRQLAVTWHVKPIVVWKLLKWSSNFLPATNLVLQLI